MDIALFEIDIILPELNQRVECLQVHRQLVVLGTRRGEFGFGLVERELERFVVKCEQFVARPDLLAFADAGVHYFAGHVWRDQHLLRADIGVVS